MCVYVYNMCKYKYMYMCVHIYTYPSLVGVIGIYTYIYRDTPAVSLRYMYTYPSPFRDPRPSGQVLRSPERAARPPLPSGFMLQRRGMSIMVSEAGTHSVCCACFLCLPAVLAVPAR